MSSSERVPEDQPAPRRMLRALTMGSLGESNFDSEAVPSSLIEIAPILRVANEVELQSPRVAYLWILISSNPLMQQQQWKEQRIAPVLSNSNKTMAKKQNTRSLSNEMTAACRCSNRKG
ncbi:hypothetical protein ZIOFF_037859 [Zingiber officinale]|uniref:Uncharacterized protein n=1 Tax=Zingiber officinale TaxID=94328 RepID=A0A8J5GC59_ZINOF|nr:hypothetical protein ZIOFF_037859 [Zingiber officinale]